MYTSAIPYYNFRNKYLIFLLLKCLNLKIVLNFIILIKQIIEIYYNHTEIFKKDISVLNFRFGGKSLITLIIPNSVKYIDNRAFVAFSKITKLTIPGSIIKIGIGAFSFCINLEELIILEGLKIISACCFEYCEKLKNVIIPESIDVIDFGAFQFCPNLLEIKIPKQTFVDFNAFNVHTKIIRF